jgi:hypothetical protein
MKFELDNFHRNISEKEILEDVSRVAKSLNKNTLTTREYKKRGGKYSSDTIIRKFSSWNIVLERSGLAKSLIRNISTEELFQNLEDVWISLGYQPKYRNLVKPLSKYSSNTYAERFGSWRKALEQFVEYMNEEGRQSSEEGIKKLKIDNATKHKTQRNVNWRLRFLVMRKDNFKCKSCGRSPASDPKIVLHVDHIKAWANGGETVLENLQTLCSICNIGKSDLHYMSTDERV